jgi:hypothetical protein
MSWSSCLAALIIAAGMAHTIWITSAVPGEVFWCGDNGMKFLMTRQFASGNFRFDIDLPQDRWVQELWAAGLYPFEPPLVVPHKGKTYIQSPYVFSLLSAPFYAIGGYRGLYALPLISCWLLWCLFFRFCVQVGFQPCVSLLALLTLVFASPLAFYAATFWEHTLAVLLSFFGVRYLLAAASEHPSLVRHATIPGAFFGFTGWLRPEGMLFVAVVCLMVAVSPPSWLRLDRRRAFIAATTMTLVLYFMLNLLIYDHPMGMHYRAFERSSEGAGALSYAWLWNLDTSRWTRWYDFFLHFNWAFVESFPLILLPLVYFLWLALAKRQRITPAFAVLIFVLLLTVGLLPALTLGVGGKQWGCRYLLILLPIAGLMLAHALQHVKVNEVRKGIRVAVYALFGILCAQSVWWNAVVGPRQLRLDYNRRIYPAQRFLRNRDIPVIAVGHQFDAQELTSLILERTFFLAKDEGDLRRLASAMHAHGQDRFIYGQQVNRVGKYYRPIETVTSDGKGLRIELSPVYRIGIFALQEARVVER